MSLEWKSTIFPFLIFLLAVWKAIKMSVENSWINISEGVCESGSGLMAEFISDDDVLSESSENSEKALPSNNIPDLSQNVTRTSTSLTQDVKELYAQIENIFVQSCLIAVKMYHTVINRPFPHKIQNLFLWTAFSLATLIIASKVRYLSSVASSVTMKSGNQEVSNVVLASYDMGTNTETLTDLKSHLSFASLCKGENDFDCLSQLTNATWLSGFRYIFDSNSGLVFPVSLESRQDGFEEVEKVRLICNYYFTATETELCLGLPSGHNSAKSVSQALTELFKGVHFNDRIKSARGVARDMFNYTQERSKPVALTLCKASLDAIRIFRTASSVAVAKFETSIKRYHIKFLDRCHLLQMELDDRWKWFNDSTIPSCRRKVKELYRSVGKKFKKYQQKSIPVIIRLRRKGTYNLQLAKKRSKALFKKLQVAEKRTCKDLCKNGIFVDRRWCRSSNEVLGFFSKMVLSGYWSYFRNRNPWLSVFLM